MGMEDSLRASEGRGRREIWIQLRIPLAHPKTGGLAMRLNVGLALRR